LTTSGVYGKSSSASSEKGETLLKAVVDKLVQHIKLLNTLHTDELF
jgi:creatinine amidohydrolase/Fe(II)-dependent formamide hydrolase-like protein